MDKSIYVISIIYPDRISIVHSRCFGSEFAARCDVEVLAEGSLDWQTRTYAVDEQKTEFEIQKLLLWRYSAERAA